MYAVPKPPVSGGLGTAYIFSGLAFVVFALKAAQAVAVPSATGGVLLDAAVALTNESAD